MSTPNQFRGFTAADGIRDKALWFLHCMGRVPASVRLGVDCDRSPAKFACFPPGIMRDMSRCKYLFTAAIAVLNKLIRRLISRKELRIYHLGRESVEVLLSDSAPMRSPHGASLRRDHWPDLLKYVPLKAGLSRQAFLSQATLRLNRGEHVYTLASDDCLLHYGWLVENKKESFYTEVAEKFRYPDNSAILYDFFTRPDIRAKGCYQDNLRQILSDLANLQSVDHIFIYALADNAASRHVIEKLGFEYYCSVYSLQCLGLRRNWRRYAQPANVLYISDRSE